MKYLAIALVMAGFTAGLMAADSSPLKDEKDKISYGYGMEIGKNLKAPGDRNQSRPARARSQGHPERRQNPAQRRRGAPDHDGFPAEDAGLAHGKIQEGGDENKTKGDAFLAENKKKEGVQTTGSGLQYKIITKGTARCRSPTTP